MHNDYWYSFSKQKTKFTTIQLIYKNFIYIPDDEQELAKNRIARIIYRNHENEILHEREVLTIEWYLASIAGLYKLLMFIIKAGFGQYLSFVSKVRWIKKLYRFDVTCLKDHSKHVSKQLLRKSSVVFDRNDQCHKLDLSKISINWHYLKYRSLISNFV